MVPIWIPLLLAAASYGANAAGQRKTDKAREAALEEMRRVRERESNKAEEAANKTGELFAQTADNQKDATAKREQQYADASTRADRQAQLSDALAMAPTSQAAATATVAEPRLTDRAQGRLAQRAKSMAALNSFGDVMAANEIASAANRADIGQAGTTMQNWAQGVLPMQLEAANQKGRNWHTLADLLQAASMVTGTAAMTAPPAGAGAGSGAAFSWDAFAPQAAAATPTAVAAPAFGTEAWNQAARNDVLNYYLRQGNVAYGP